jgi:HEAT repeat protein
MFDWLTLRKLKAEEAHVRLAALLEIGAITSPKVFDFILGMLKDREFRVRSEAASALGRAQLPGAGDKLMLLVSGPESELRYLAARALKAMNWKPTASVDRASLAIGVHNFDAAIAEGSEAIAPLLLEVRTGWEPHIAEALDALIRLGAQAVPLVIDLFRGSKRDVAFAKTLVRLADKGGLLFINEILGGSDAEMRKTLCEVLRYERLEGAADALIQVVKDSSTDLSTRSAAVSALSQIGGAAVASALIAVFNGATEENFKGDIIKALGDMKSKAAVTMLIDAISNDKSVRVRSMAAYHLGLIGDTRAKGALLRALDDRERDIVASVAHGLEFERRWTLSSNCSPPFQSACTAMPAETQ